MSSVNEHAEVAIARRIEGGSSRIRPSTPRWTFLAALLLAQATASSSGGSAAAQTTYDPAPVVQLAAQPPPRLLADAPLAAQLANGLVVIRYRAVNLRFVAAYGPPAVLLSPRVGHLHVTVDDAPWHWADASGEPLIIQGLAEGRHEITLELADPIHRVLDRKVIELVIPGRAAPHH